MMSEAITWADLPVEILENILKNCDTPTLLSLSHLDTQLNALALDCLFKREKFTKLEAGYLHTSSKPHEIIPALNAALWLNRLPHIIYHPNSDVKYLFSDMRGFERFVGRLHTINSLELNLIDLNRWPSDQEIGDITKIDPVAWRDVFVGLLETALNKGCLSMYVMGGHQLQTRYAYHPIPNAHQLISRVDSLIAEISRHTRHVYSVANALADSIHAALHPPHPNSTVPTVQATPARLDLLIDSAVLEILEHFPIPMDDYVSIPVSFQTSNPCLKVLDLWSSMMFQPLFFSDTLNLIRAHSPTLETLTLVNIVAPYYVWTEFFVSVSLSVMKNFKVIIPELVIIPQVLLDFFRRNPSLETVYLNYVRFKSQPQELEVEFPAPNEVLLPNLESLDSQALLVSRLLQSPIARPRFSCISLRPGRATASIAADHDPYEDFGAGIRAISSLLSSSVSLSDSDHSHSSTSSQSIHLRFKFETDGGLREWFDSHMEPDTTQSSPLRLPTNISKLTISADCNPMFHHVYKPILAEFLGLLPNVKVVELDDLDSPEAMDDEAFIQDVKGHVRNLERFKVQGTVIWEQEETGGERP